MKYSPFILVAAPKEVPLTTILHPIRGWLFSSTTLPEIFPVVPAKINCKKIRQRIKACLFERQNS